MNFFQSAAQANQANHFYRIFDLTHVPSQFVGTNTVLNPEAFNYGPFDNSSQLAPGNTPPHQAPAQALLLRAGGS